MNLSILYRGALSSCNYGCHYCPFNKRTESKAQLARDRRALLQFTDWLQRQSQHCWKVLFTPWGEALVRRWYRDAVTALTHVDHIESVAVQTNLACGLDWIEACATNRLVLWATYHPTESDARVFVGKVQRLRSLGVRISVGMVGVPEFLDQAVDLRHRLPSDVYLWINAQQPRQRPYTPHEIELLNSIDPQFELTARRQPSLGKSCRTGEAMFSVDETGDMRRCHFVDEVIGNIHGPNWEKALRSRPCPNRFCDCYLGKAQLQADALAPFFGATFLERLPRPELSFGIASSHSATSSIPKESETP
jgi:hypothetical protein